MKSAVLALACMAFTYTAASAMTLEYDGGIYEYDGSIYTLVVNNSVLNPPLSPIIFNDHALVPVREIFEELGALVEYDMDTRTVDVIKDDYTISMSINDNVAYVNGEKTVIPDGVAPKLISELGGETKTMVPVRFISESIGLDVEFDYPSGTILIESREYLDEIYSTPEPQDTPDSTVDADNMAGINTNTPLPPLPTQTKKPSKRPIEERPIGNENGVTNATLEADFVMQGVDVSHWQNIIDWSKAKDDIDFAILSMGYGQDLESQDDRQFKRNASECEKYGIPYGVYIYSYAQDIEMAKGEAEHVLRVIDGCNLTFPVYYDLEDKSQADFEPELLGEMAEAFCGIIEDAGYEVGIYANTTWWTSKLTSPAFDNPNWHKWVAQYNTQCTYEGKYTMWQYTSSGAVSGMEGDIDMNYWYGKIRL